MIVSQCPTGVSFGGKSRHPNDFSAVRRTMFDGQRIHASDRAVQYDAGKDLCRELREVPGQQHGSGTHVIMMVFEDNGCVTAIRCFLHGLDVIEAARDIGRPAMHVRIDRPAQKAGDA